MGSRIRLFRLKKPYETDRSNDLFLHAMRQNCAYHEKHCAEYRKILNNADFSAEQLREYADISKIPPIPTLFFKRHHIHSMSRRRSLIHATSSGTSGQFSDIRFDTGGLWAGLHMVLTVAKDRHLLSARPCHYIVMGYRPHRSNKTAIAKTAYGYTFFAPALDRTFALKYHDGQYTPDLDGIIDAILRHSRSRFPTRFIGFPAYTWFVLNRMEERGITVKLPRHSIIMLGGGWKQFYREQVDKREFYEKAERILGVPEDHIIEAFGAAEHPILYLDCPHHHFHVPVYSRVIIRDVHTLEPLENGRLGLINLLTPMVRATPIQSIMTDDLGILHDGNTCPCGITSPWLEIVGRVGLKDIKTCAAGAGDILAASLGKEKRT